MSTATKVVIILVVAGVLICGGAVTALIIGGYKFFEWAVDKVQDELARDRDWQAFGITWRSPPANAPREKLFPARVGDYKLAPEEDRAVAPPFNIKLAGQHALYLANGQTIEVFAWRASNQEREAVYRDVIETLKHGSGMNMHVQLNQRLRYNSSQLDENGAFWGNGQWLFLARSAKIDDLEPFLRSYLEAIADKPEFNKPTQSTASRK